MTDKIAAVWARVSTEERQEPSLPSQVADVKTWLEDQGWTVPKDRIIMTHWTSKNILACPDMQKLLGWVRNREVGAVGLLHLDRFACRMGQMAQILDTFREAEAEILAKNSPLQSGLLGEAMAMVMTIAKAMQVERADEGSKDGLRKRATLRGLPTTAQAPYGYRWNEAQNRLLATEKSETRRFIVRTFLEGETIHGIKRKLHELGIPSPKGFEWWRDQTIWLILVDTVNYGEYRALRREAVEPKERRGKQNGAPTYGKTSSRKLEGMPLPNIVVESPIITREEYDLIMGRMARNKANARRNSKYNFLLKSMIHYELDGRRYHGRHIRDNIWCYEYPDNGFNKHNHPRPYLNGPWLESSVEAMARKLLSDEAVLGSELERSEGVIRESIDNLRSELRNLERRENANTNAHDDVGQRHL
jgi:site-specific DNA recombinase